MPSTYPVPAVIPTPNVGSTVSVLVAPPNTTRNQLYVFNIGPNIIWVSPAMDNAYHNIVASAGGQGSVPLSPNTGAFFPSFTTGMQAIAQAGTTNVVTIWEYY